MPGQSGDHATGLSDPHDSSATRSAEAQSLPEGVELDSMGEHHRQRQEFALLLDSYFADKGHASVNEDPYYSAGILCKKGLLSAPEVIDLFSIALSRNKCAHEDWVKALSSFTIVYPPFNSGKEAKSAAAKSLNNFITTALNNAPENSQAVWIYHFLSDARFLFDRIAIDSTKKESTHDEIYCLFDEHKDSVCDHICQMSEPTQKADAIEKALSKRQPLGRLFWRQRGMNQTILQAGTLARLCAAYEPRQATGHEPPGIDGDKLLQSASTGDIETLQAELTSANLETICPAMFVAIRNPDQGQSLEVLRALFNELKRFPESFNRRSSVTDESGNTLLMQAVLFQNQPAIDYLLSESAFDPGYENNDGHTIFDVAEIALYGGRLRALKARLNETLRPPSSSDEAYEFVANPNQQALAWSSFSFTGSLYSLFCRADNQPPEAVDRDVDSDEDSSSHGL